MRSRSGHRVARAITRSLVVALTGVLLVGLGTAPAMASTSWGTAGARYSGGLLCRLPGGDRVPMARWQVDGREAFASADVLGTPSGDGSAPLGGTLAPFAVGQYGLDGRGIAELAYLIAHHGDGTPAETAEVSAAVAATFGGGSSQARCLGQQGTSATAMASLRSEAARLAGPYHLAVDAPSATQPGNPATVSVAVLAASGAPVPDIEVTATGAGQSVIGSTDTQGTARLALTTPALASSTVTVSVFQPTGLLLAADTTPAAVVPASPSRTTATTTVVANLHPHPGLRIDVGGGLYPEHSTVTPIAHVSGTAGFAGTGTVTLAGPAAPGRGGSCAALAASAFAAAPNAWSRTFTFDGDGARSIGHSPRLVRGCYVAGGSITVSGAAPAVDAYAPFEGTAVLEVIPLTVHRSALPVLALPGRVSTTVTVDGADGASVSNDASVFGPVDPRNGRCDTVSWGGAPMAGGATPATRQSAGGDARSVILNTRSLTARGCYSVRTSTTVERDGRALTVRPNTGASGTVVFVVQPTFQLADDTYDTTQGTPMTGLVDVAGTFRYPAIVTIRLRSAAARPDGCRSAVFTARATGPAASTRTTGDGTFRFRTPSPSANTCYAIESSLQMVDASAVRVAGAAPTSATIFLAGRPPELRIGPAPAHRGGHTMRAATILLGSGVLMLVLAVAVIVLVRRHGIATPLPRRANRPGDFEDLACADSAFETVPPTVARWWRDGGPS